MAQLKNGSIIGGNTFTIGNTVYSVANGNVGVGNNAPAHKLRVEGTLSISSGLQANGSLGTAGQVLYSNGSAIYWASAAAGTVDLNATYSWTNTHSFSNTVTIKAISANGGLGTAGQVLHSNGTSTYWDTDDQGVTSVATGNGLTGGTITTTGTVSALANTGIVANSTGLFVNSSYIATITANNATYAFGKSESALNVNSALTSNNSSYLGGTIASGYQTTAGLSANVATLSANNTTYLNGQLASYYTNATNITTGTLPWAQAPTGTVNTSGAFTFTGVHTLNANVVIGSGVSANGSYGTAGQVLHSNGTATYWDTDDQGVTSVATGNGLTGGTITATGTVSALANTGIVANATGLFVNSSYIATITANNATYAFGKSESALNVNSALTSNNSTYAFGKSESGINANSALTANNASYLGGTIASGYQTTAGLSANVATLTANAATYLGSSASFGNSSGIYTTGTINAASYTVATNFIANSSSITINSGAVTARATTGQFRLIATNSDVVHAVQDGSGRYNILWNSSGTASPTYLVSSEPVLRLGITTSSTSNGGNFNLYGAPSGTAGGAITYNQFFGSTIGEAASTNNFIWMSPRGTSSDFYMVASGNVGIGTSSPSARLQVATAGSSGGEYGLYLQNPNTSAYSTVKLALLGGSAIRTEIIGQQDNTGSGGTFVINTANTSGSQLERMRITSSGNVGIGTSSPVNKLTINGGVSLTSDYETYLVNAYYASSWKYIANGMAWGIGNNFGGPTNGICIAAAATNASGADAALTWLPRFNIDSSGKVGIGNTSPGFMLDVYNSSTANDYVVGRFYTDAAATGESRSWLKIEKAPKYGGAVGGYLSQGVGGGLLFGTQNNTDTPTERMRIDNNGNVGIGNTAPAAKLHVTAASTTAPSLTWGASAGQILRNENSELAIGLSSSAPYPLYFQGRRSSNTVCDISLQPLGGYVGIGTSSPAYTLDVNGYVGASRYYLTNTNSVYAYGDTAGWVYSGAGYVFFAQSGSTYSNPRIVARSGISDDTNATLTLYGGTGGYTTVNGSTRSPVFYDSDDTNAYFDANDLILRGTSPTIRFRDTDGNSSMIHVNSNTFYILRGGNDTGTWTQVNSQWPLMINLTNNDATFGATVIAITDMRAPIFYDYNNTAYYIDAASTSVANNVQITTLGVGTAASGTTGEIRATGDITSAYSDARLKTNIQTIDNAIAKVKKLSGIRYQNNDLAISHGYKNEDWQIGVLAQEVEQVLPEIVKRAPFDTTYIDGEEVSKSGENYKTVQYDKLIPLLIEAIKEQQKQIDALTAKIGG